MIPLYEYNIDLNDGKSYGMDDYKECIDTYLTEDYFSAIRSEYLNKLIFEFFLECFWNSKLTQLTIEIVYSGTIVCDELISLKDGLTEFKHIAELQNLQ